MTRLRCLLLLLPIALIQVGCSSADTSTSNGNVDAEGNTVSSVPWNKPESWETEGQLGNAVGH
jgi:PBP1b-binding outer membrane lipoprotein LpoB